MVLHSSSSFVMNSNWLAIAPSHTANSAGLDLSSRKSSPTQIQVDTTARYIMLCYQDASGNADRNDHSEGPVSEFFQLMPSTANRTIESYELVR